MKPPKKIHNLPPPITHCQAPAKLIITGEHAVLNGVPALTMALDLPTHCELQYLPTPQNWQKSHWRIELVDYKQIHELPFPLWEKQSLEIEAHYDLFRQRTLAIQMVLKQPIDLILATLWHFHQHSPLSPGLWRLRIHSKSWTGRGLGSSASIIVSLLSALQKTTQASLSTSVFHTLAQKIENRQHGQSSGIDTTIVQQGGVLKYQCATSTQPAQYSPLPFHSLELPSFHATLIDTGAPLASTGTTVQQVQQHFPASHPIWSQFLTCEQAIETAWRQRQSEAFRSAIQTNEQLLEEISVVPPKVQRFIQALHAQPKTAAKICGAGSVHGEKAGVILCLSPEPPKALCERYHYRWQPIKLSPKGVHCYQQTASPDAKLFSEASG